MGSALSSDSLTVDQFRMFLDDLKSRSASVVVTVSAFHYEMYEEEDTDWEREDWERRHEDMWEESGGRRHHRHGGARPPSPRRSTVRQRKVETFREEHHLPLEICEDLTGAILLPELSAAYPLMRIKLTADIFPMDGESSEILDQYKMHLAAHFQNRDKIVETTVSMYLQGQRKVTEDPIWMTVYEPQWEEEAGAGCCCFGRPNVKDVKINIIKKFVASPLHFSGNQVTPVIRPNVPSAPQDNLPSETIYVYPPVTAYPPQPSYPSQPAYAPQGGYPTQGGYPPQACYPPQTSYNSTGYTAPIVYQPEAGYPPQTNYPQQSSYNPQAGYP